MQARGDTRDGGGIPQPIAGRYAIEETLGRGGMGLVYRVTDEVDGRALALKQLHSDLGPVRDKATLLFQQEYQTLVQLTHPRIVRAFDYGVDGEQPFYTMELLDGEDLSGAAPLAWREVARLLRDIASALAMVHSRRLVHRDVTPRNVRRVSGGGVKLIDFGAMTPMERPSSVVGTPPFMAPEAVNSQPLDGRADLYALGAFAYWLLTGRHAYPARRLDQLRDLWRSRPIEPHAINDDIPEALGALVLSLLSLDPSGRPANAPEVMDRLSAIADLPADEELGLARAYLTTPKLLGRGQQILQFRKLMLRAVRGRGGSMTVEAQSGMGHSRLLANYVLEGRLAGASVAYVDAAAGVDDLGTARALLQALLAGFAERPALPEALEWLLSDRFEHDSDELELEELSQRQADARDAMLQWCEQRARSQPLLLAVDNIHCCDKATCALLAELARMARDYRMAIVATYALGEAATAPKAVEAFRERSRAQHLEPLSQKDTEKLLRSIFGDAQNLRAVTRWVYECGQGRPRASMDLAQHLVDAGLATHQGGVWTLAGDPHALGLPTSVGAAMAARVEQLSPMSRELATVLAFVEPNAPLDAEHYPRLFEPSEHRAVVAALQDLVSANVLVARGDGHRFAQRGLVDVLQAAAGEARAAEVHEKLAKLYASDAHKDVYTAAHHYFEAGKPEAAREVLLAELRRPRTIVGTVAQRNYDLTIRVQKKALEGATEKRDIIDLHRGLLATAALHEPSNVVYGWRLIEQLRYDVGLVYYDDFASEPDPQQRIARCYQRAIEAYQAGDEEARWLRPDQGLAMMVFALVTMGAACRRLCDVSSLDQVHEVAERLRPLGASLAATADTVHLSRQATRGIDTAAYVAELLERFDGDVGIHPSLMHYIHTTIRYNLAVVETRLGGSKSLRMAEEIEASQERFTAATQSGYGRHRAWHVRWLAHLYRGEVHDAEYCRDKLDLFELDGLDPSVVPNLRTALHYEAKAHALGGALLPLKAAVAKIEEYAEQCDGWRPIADWARGEVQQLRGDPATAVQHFEHARAHDERHMIWAWATTALIETKLKLGDVQQAAELVARARDNDTIKLAGAAIRFEFERVAALVESKLDRHEAAVQRLERVLAEGEVAGLGGVPWGLVMESRASVALAMDDHDAFEHATALVGQAYQAVGNPQLVARYERLLAMGRESKLGTGETLSESELSSLAATSHSVVAAEELRTQMQSCERRRDRVHCALSRLLEVADGESGYLYTFEQDGLKLAAPLEGAEPPGDLELVLSQLIELEQFETTQIMDAGGLEALYDTGYRANNGIIYHPIMLMFDHEDHDLIAGVAAVQTRSGSPPKVSWTITRVISKTLTDAGDVVSVIAG